MTPVGGKEVKHVSKSVETVLGPVSCDRLGFTLMHEHLLLSSWDARIADPERLPVREALDLITPVIQDAYDAGVRTLVDVTTYNMGRDMEILREVRAIAASPEELRGLLDALRAAKEPPKPKDDKEVNGI